MARNKDGLEKHGNKIDGDRSLSIAARAKIALENFDKFKLTAGPLSRLINQAANGDLGESQFYETAIALLQDPLAL